MTPHGRPVAETFLIGLISAVGVLLLFGLHPVHADAPGYTWRAVNANGAGVIELNDTANTGVSVVIHANPLANAIISFQDLEEPPFGGPPLPTTTPVKYYVIGIQTAYSRGVPSVVCIADQMVTGGTRMYLAKVRSWNSSQNYWAQLNSTVRNHTICASMDESQLLSAGIAVGTAQVTPPAFTIDPIETLELASIFAAIIIGIAYFWRRMDRSKYKPRPFSVPKPEK